MANLQMHVSMYFRTAGCDSTIVDNIKHSSVIVTSLSMTVIAMIDRVR